LPVSLRIRPRWEKWTSRGEPESRPLSQPFQPGLMESVHAVRPGRVAKPSQPPILVLFRDYAAAGSGPFDKPSVIGIDSHGVGGPGQSLARHELLHLRQKIDTGGSPSEYRASLKLPPASLDPDVTRSREPRRPRVGPDQPGPDPLWRYVHLQLVVDVNCRPLGGVLLRPAEHREYACFVRA